MLVLRAEGLANVSYDCLCLMIITLKQHRVGTTSKCSRARALRFQWREGVRER